MGVNKLDIEFEDEEEIRAREEAEKKKREAVVQDVDLEFDVGEDIVSPESSTPEPEPQAEPVKKEEPKAAAPAKAAVAKTEKPVQQQPVQQQVQQQPVQQQQVQQQQGGVLQFHNQAIAPTNVSVGPDYKLGDELKKAMVTSPILAIEMEARIQVETHKRTTDIIAKHAAEAKLLEHKIGKMISQIHAKVPALKKELMMMKKLLAEHAAIGEEKESLSAESSETKPSNPAQKQVVKKKAS